MNVLFGIKLLLVLWIPLSCHEVSKGLDRREENTKIDSLALESSQFDSFQVTKGIYIEHLHDDENRKDTTYYHGLFVEMPTCFQPFLSSLDERFERSTCALAFETCWQGRDSILDDRRLNLVIQDYESTGLYDGPYFVGLTLNFLDEDKKHILVDEDIADRYRQYFQKILDGLACRN